MVVFRLGVNLFIGHESGRIDNKLSGFPIVFLGCRTWLTSMHFDDRKRRGNFSICEQ